MEKNKVAIFISHYLPGYKMGGPINSVYNIAKKLKGQFDFYIITSDRDFGDDIPYQNIETGKWIDVKGNKVMYFNPTDNYYINIFKHLRTNKYDIVYLNSLFEFKFSIFIIFLNFFSVGKSTKIIVAPRGELYKEAISFGRIKKNIFLKAIKRISVYKKVVWHSTNKTESQVILDNFPEANIQLADVISDYSKETITIKTPEFILREKNVLKIIYLSRISKDKNLLFAIKTLSKVDSFVEFHIYGPVEDEKIWEECKREIKLLRQNIRVQYKGKVEKKYVKSYFSQYDLFFLPTYRENFGHVISESLSVGTPVLISDNTPWRGLQSKKLGWDLSLENEYEFVQVILQYSKKNCEEKSKFRKTVLESYAEYINEEKIIRENMKLFRVI